MAGRRPTKLPERRPPTPVPKTKYEIAMKMMTLVSGDCPFELSKCVVWFMGQVNDGRLKQRREKKKQTPNNQINEQNDRIYFNSPEFRKLAMISIDLEKNVHDEPKTQTILYNHFGDDLHTLSLSPSHSLCAQMISTLWQLFSFVSWVLFSLIILVALLANVLSRFP